MDVEIATGDIHLWLLDAVSIYLLTVSQAVSGTASVFWELRSPHHHAEEDVLVAIESLKARGLVEILTENADYRACIQTIAEYGETKDLSQLRFRLTETGVVVWERFSRADYHKYVRLDYLPDSDGYDSVQFSSLSEEAALWSEVDPVFWTTGIDGKWGWNRGQLGESWLVL